MKKHVLALLLLSLCAQVFSQESLRIFPSGTLYSAGGNVTVYPEGFVLEAGQKLFIDGEKEAVLRPGVIVVTLSDGSRLAEDTVRVVAASPSSRRLRVLCIGESTTATVSRNPWSGSTDDGWNWVSMMQTRGARDGADIVCLGTESLTGQASYTAHGGWSAYTFLTWPCAAKIDPHAPSHFFKAEAMWYALGLRSVTGEPYNGETRQHDLMARTPFGKYRPDGDAVLWNFVREVSGTHGYPEFTGKGKYKGSAKQLAALEKWTLALAENPVNEFYSLEAARSGDCAFSLEAYLERYRTMDDNGIRLPAVSENPARERVRGSDGKYYTIGSRIVTRALLKKVSVCAPTHVVVNIGINDGDSGTSVDAAAGALSALMSCFGTLPCAHFVNRWPGACNPALWGPSFKPRQYGINGNNTRVMAILRLFREWASGRPNIDVLDVWHCQNPASQLEEKLQDGVLVCDKDDVHTGFSGQMSSSLQVLGWLYSR